jgi:hypothetical protein
VTHLTKFQHAELDITGAVGQRAISFRFDIVDAVTGYRRQVHPLRKLSATLAHDTQRTIKRTISGLLLDREDTLAFNSVSSRLELFMIIRESEFFLGRYVPSDWARFVSTGGTTSSASFYDEMFIIDQQTSTSFGANTVNGELVSSLLQRFVSRFSVSFQVEPTPFISLGAWSVGARGGSIIEQLALDGDYLSPWFDNDSVLRFKRPVDPRHELPSFDFDHQNFVLRAGIVESDNLINAPNRFIVVGNGASSFDGPVVGVADVPSSAPHSIQNRGFVVPEVSNRQVFSSAQAGLIAANLAQAQTLVEQVTLTTLADPRHDSYDVVLWQGERWVEVAWSLPLSAGAPMSNTLRKVYS